MLTPPRAFAEILRFELRLHLASPLFWGVALLFFVLHLLTLTRTGINLGDNQQIAINSAWLIFQTELVLGVFGMLPAMFFTVTAMTRDIEHQTTELFFTTPLPRTAFLLGRFCAGTLIALLIGCIGLSGALIGSFMRSSLREASPATRRAPNSPRSWWCARHLHTGTSPQGITPRETHRRPSARRRSASPWPRRCGGSTWADPGCPWAGCR